MKRGILTLFALFFFSFGPLACSDEASCESTCSEAQSRSCTAVTGDCGNFCDAVFNVEEPSGCADERVAYQDCLESGDVCANSCSSLEDDLTNCLGGYCAGNLTDPDCQVLINSF